MSGIAGLIRLDGGPLEPGLIEAMTGAMAHRGPDGSHAWSRGSVALGQCMLRTTPESLEETQPLANEDESVVLVMDGRVDNWEELRAELLAQGARLRTRADAELVLRAYERWGHDCVQRMDGDFALAIWDERRREAFCARDRMGHKPFHYHWDGKRLAIASELHAILALPWVEEELNEGMLAEHLAWELISLDETFWKGVLRLPPANRMKVGIEGPRIRRYWSPDLERRLRYKHESEYIEHYRSLLEDVVRRQSRAAAPVAAEVSGGLDSSAIFAVADVLRRRGGLPAPAVDAYTLRFDGGAAGLDLDFARAVCAHLDCPLTEVEPAKRPLEWYRDWARRYRDFPGYPNGIMHESIYEAALHRGSRVVLSGSGGDQLLFSDFKYYAKTISTGDWREFARCLALDVRTYGLRSTIYLLSRYGLFPLLPNWLGAVIKRALARSSGNRVDDSEYLSESLAKMIKQRTAKFNLSHNNMNYRIYREKIEYSFGADHVFSHELTDRLASSFGQEVRRPLNNPNLYQYIFSIPRYMLINQHGNRYVHRRAIKNILPDKIVYRVNKGEFSKVFDQHRDELKWLIDNHSNDTFRFWTSQKCLGQLRAAAETELLGENAWRLWRLFGCFAVVHDGINRAKLCG